MGAGEARENLEVSCRVAVWLPPSTEEVAAHGFELAADALPLPVELREHGGHVSDDEGVQSEARRDGDDREHLLDGSRDEWRWVT